MNRTAIFTTGALVAIATCATALSQVTIERAPANDVLIRINGPIHIGPGDSAASVVVINNDVVMEGTVTEQLIVINGRARISGQVRRNVVVLGGVAEMEKGARVGEDVTLFRSSIQQDPQATIAGRVIERSSFSFSQRSLLWFWLGMTLVVVVAGVLYATISPTALTEAAALLTERSGGSVLAAMAVWVGIPLVAFIAVLSVIGIPLAIALLAFLLPALWFLGYLVVGARIGVAVVRSAGGEAGLALTVTAGLVSLQTIGLVPGLGGLVICLAGALGAGALLQRVWHRLHEHATVAVPPVAPA